MDDPWVTSLTPPAMRGLLTYPCGVVTEPRLSLKWLGMVIGHPYSFYQAPCRGCFRDLSALDGDFALSLAVSSLPFMIQPFLSPPLR